MVFGGTQHPAVSPLSARVYKTPLRFALAYNSAPCCFRSPSSLHASLLHSATLHFIGLHSAYLSAPLLGADFRFISSASAPLLPVFIGFHFHFRGLVTPLRSAHAPTGIPSAHTRSLSNAFPSSRSLALNGARIPRTNPVAVALPPAFYPYSATLHINKAKHLPEKTPPHTLAYSNPLPTFRGSSANAPLLYICPCLTVCSPQFSANLTVSAHLKSGHNVR